MLPFLKQVILNVWLSKHNKLSKFSSKPEKCPYCKEKDPDQLAQMGEDTIKCMSCCNIYDN